MISKITWGLHWFRRDLRVQGNSALLWNVQRNEGRTLGVFFFDRIFLKRPDFSHARFAFFLKTLAALREELQKMGSDLLVLESNYTQAFPHLFRNLKQAGAPTPSVVSFNRDYEPYARKRDAEVSEILKNECGVEVQTACDHLLLEPDEIQKKENGYYQVFTPFSRKWLEQISEADVQRRIEDALLWPKFAKMMWGDLFVRSSVPKDQLKIFEKENSFRVAIPIPDAGSEVAKLQLKKFKTRIENYGLDRDKPALSATSGLSIFLKNGSLTVAQIISSFKLEKNSKTEDDGRSVFLKELIWREFFYHILWHAPFVEKESFLKKYRNITWENQLDYFEAWKSGQTGYPIVDAGMRELNQTGRMHNRVRMIVASFLVKDLHIDWRWGERYFMEKLLDGDLACNNGGWQWAASTGCDPQPYFRIFNPTLQSIKFDPDGKYLLRWLPERARLSGKLLHSPINPIIDHTTRARKSLEFYRSS